MHNGLGGERCAQNRQSVAAATCARCGWQDIDRDFRSAIGLDRSVSRTYENVFQRLSLSRNAVTKGKDNIFYINNHDIDNHLDNQTIKKYIKLLGIIKIYIYIYIYILINEIYYRLT